MLILSDTDKLGLLIKCREKMDELNQNELRSFAHGVVNNLSLGRLETILFVGFNSIKKDMDYAELQQMNESIDKIIKKKRKLTKENCKEDKANNGKAKILKVPKNASLSKTIPSDIIGNNICSFLMMRGITSLARCDRKFAIICHSPVAVTNLMYGHDPYSYGWSSEDISIDGDFEWNSLQEHRVKNVNTLSITAGSLHRIHYFPRLSSLTLYGDVDHAFSWPNIGPLQQPIEKLCYARLFGYPMVNIIDDKDVISKIRSLSFVECEFEDLIVASFDPSEPDMFKEYNKTLGMLLPPQPNNLQILKFVDSCLTKTNDTICTQANEKFENLENIKASLSNLKAFVYVQTRGEDDEGNLLYKLSQNILRNLNSFQQLKSCHIHSTEPDDELQSFAFNGLITELCFTQSLEQQDVFWTVNKLVTFQDLTKLCLVIDVSEDNISEQIDGFEQLMRVILFKQKRLTLLQIVFLLDSGGGRDSTPDFCAARIRVLNKFINGLSSILFDIYSPFDPDSPLLLKIHVKSSHYQAKSKCTLTYMKDMGPVEKLSENINQLIMNYLVTYPLGKIQFKWTCNSANHRYVRSELESRLKRLHGIFRIAVKCVGDIDVRVPKNKYCHNDVDGYEMFTISASTKDLADKNVHHQNKWIADCKWCCNTPWV